MTMSSHRAFIGVLLFLGVLAGCSAQSEMIRASVELSRTGVRHAAGEAVVERDEWWAEAQASAEDGAEKVALRVAYETQVLADHSPARLLVCVQPMGEIEVRWAESVAQRLERRFGVRTRVLPSVPVPESTWYPPRRRYRADQLIDWIVEADYETSDGCFRTLAVLEVDISSTVRGHEDWGIFGLGSTDGSVVSTFRLQGDDPTDDHLRLRVQRVAEHETGHMLGAPHILGNACMMVSANGGIDVLEVDIVTLCDETRDLIEFRHGIRLPTRPEFDP